MIISLKAARFTLDNLHFKVHGDLTLRKKTPQEIWTNPTDTRTEGIAYLILSHQSYPKMSASKKRGASEPNLATVTSPPSVTESTFLCTATPVSTEEWRDQVTNNTSYILLFGRNE